MKTSFCLLLILIILTSCASDRNYNLPDIEDVNRVPERQENREEEFINQQDEYDGNRTPGKLEERENEEERIKVYDDPIF